MSMSVSSVISAKMGINYPDLEPVMNFVTGSGYPVPATDGDINYSTGKQFHSKTTKYTQTHMHKQIHTHKVIHTEALAKLYMLLVTTILNADEELGEKRLTIK